MKKHLTAIATAATLLFCSTTTAQDITKGSPGMYPSFIDFKDAPPAFKKGTIHLTDETGNLLSASPTVELISTEKDQLGMEHYRYRQVFNGIPVELSMYLVHVQSGKVVSENGDLVKDFPAQLKSTASINKTAALKRATAFIGAKTYKWEVPSEEAFIKKDRGDSKATFYPKAETVWYSGEHAIDPVKLKLAYKFDIYAHQPLSRSIVFIDAQTGEVLGKRELIHTTNAPGTAVTAYSGTQSITTDYTGSTYRLRETGRGNGIQTFNMKNAGINYGAAVDFTDADNNWNNVNANLDQYATDAHWGAEKTYDYYKNKYNRNSIDNAGFALKNYVHTNLIAFGRPDNINAFWDGDQMTYGDGGTLSDGTAIKPLTALDIIGHEITHGLTEKTSNLIYDGESGALNEGFSDIFGTAIEFYSRPSRANWTIGEDIGLAFRSMSNPNQNKDPDTYQGTYWQFGGGDNGGVHTNSGVLNFWFYLLSQGGNGTNDNGTVYSVTGIGIDKAAAIAFRANTVYLTSSANFATARQMAVKSAQDLYGATSNEVKQTECAWAAVGIGSCYNIQTCNAPTGLSVTGTTNTSATVKWNAVSGAVGYRVEYKKSSTSITTWEVATTNTTATSFTINNLTSNVAFDWRVRTICSANVSSYVNGTTFTTTSVASSCTNAYEPNGTFAQATPITSGSSYTAAIATADEDDIYKLVIPSASNLICKITVPKYVDFSFELYNASGYQINYTSNFYVYDYTKLSYTIATDGLSAGTYYIKVRYLPGTSSANCYTFSATYGCRSSYDAYPNETMPDARAIPYSTNIKGAIEQSGDIDYYSFRSNGTINLTLALSSLPADYDLKLYNAAGAVVAYSQKSGTASDTVKYTAGPGLYYAQVYGYGTNSNASSCYNLKATFTGPTCKSSYDAASNGTISGAATIPLNTDISGVMDSETDVDYYKLVVTTSGTLNITQDDYSDNLTLCNSSGATLAVSTSLFTNSIQYNITPGTYYIKVDTYGSYYPQATGCYILKAQLGSAATFTENLPAITDNKNTLNVYPNPVNSILTIDVPLETGNTSAIYIVDSKGAIVLKQQANSRQENIDVSKLPSGIYMVQVNNGKENLSSKFVKQ